MLSLQAPEGESQPSTEVDLFISTEKIMVLNTDLKVSVCSVYLCVSMCVYVFYLVIKICVCSAYLFVCVSMCEYVCLCMSMCEYVCLCV